MKPIIIESYEISESTEYYSSRPHPFFTLFIYMLLAMLCIALGWMFYFKMDIVVKAQGTITTKDNLVTITNTYAGNIMDINVKDGQKVKKGDILFSVKSDDLDSQMAQQEKSLSDIKDRLTISNAYLNWLKGESGALDALKENQFYEEYEARKELVDLNTESVKKSTDKQTSQDNTSMKSTQSSIDYYKDEIAKYNQMLTAFENQTNPFTQSDTDAYYYSYVKDYIEKYTVTKKQYDDKINTLNSDITNCNNQKTDNTNQINTLNDDITNSNQKIQNATQKITVLQNTQTQSLEQETTEQVQNSTNEQTADGQDTVSSEQQVVATEQANVAADKDQITKLNTSNTAIDTQVKSDKDQIDTYKNSQTSDLNSLKADSVASVEQMIKTAEETLQTLNSNLEATKDDLKNASNSLDQSLTKSSEITKIYTDIATYKDSEKQIEDNMSELKNSLGQMTLKATQSGVINLLETIEKGDYLAAGKDVMTIIPNTPNSSSYSVDIYVPNQKIGQLKKGMKVKYEIASYPTEEYGTVTGKIETISEDTKVSDRNGTSYYKVTASINKYHFYSKNGKNGSLKVGMACQRKIVTGRKSIMKYVLEKIHLMD